MGGMKRTVCILRFPSLKARFKIPMSDIAAEQTWRKNCREESIRFACEHVCKRK